MNIIVRTYGGRTVFRPETTWKRDDEHAYLPENVSQVTLAPVIYARISRPGKGVGLKFAERYYDAVGFGALLYPEDMIDGSPEGFACASCVDHTTFLTVNVFDRDAALGFKLVRDGEEFFSFNQQTGHIIAEAISKATGTCFVRTGDFIAIELSERRTILTRDEGKCTIDGFADASRQLSFDIVL